MNETKRMFFECTKAEPSGEGRAAAIITTNTVDRQGEIVDPDGLDLTNFLRIGSVLYGHHYDGMEGIPVGRPYALELIHDGDQKQLRAEWEWQEDDVSPLITAVKKSWQRDFLRTVSIGFIPLEWERESKVPTITKAELLEFSIVPVPANPQAMRLNGLSDDEMSAITRIELLDKAMTYLKEGRVLSSHNYALVKECVDSLQALLDATDGKSASGDAQPDDEAVLKALTYLYLTT